MSAGLSLSFPLFFLGLILFAAVTFWAGVYPRWMAVLLVISVPVTMSSTYGRNVPGVDRTGVVGVCGGGLWFLRLEESTLDYLLLRI